MCNILYIIRYELLDMLGTCFEREGFEVAVASDAMAAQHPSGLDRRYRNLYDYGMKTTLDINDTLLANAKALAARQRTSLTRLIEEGLQLRLRSPQVAAKAGKRRIPVFKGCGGLVPGLNPASNKAMLDAADDDA
jgi:hypothetical protein